VLSGRAVDGHQMYFGRSVLGKDSIIGIDISPTPPLIFTGGGGSKAAKFGVVFNFQPLAFENAANIRILKQKCNGAMIALCPGQV